LEFHLRSSAVLRVSMYRISPIRSSSVVVVVAAAAASGGGRIPGRSYLRSSNMTFRLRVLLAAAFAAMVTTSKMKGKTRLLRMGVY